MKFILLTVILSFNFLTLQSSLDGMVNALKRGNASQLSMYLDTNIELELDNKKITYSRSQAELILKDFFNVNTVKNFEFLRMEKSNNQAKYCLGTLNTVNGLFHTTIYLKQEKNDLMVEEIHFLK